MSREVRGGICECSGHTFLGLAAVLALGFVAFGLAAALGFVTCATSGC